MSETRLNVDLGGLPPGEALDWEKGGGLLPAVVQDADTLQVLMLGYVDREALDRTLATGLVTFFSRSKNRLWTKGETSGHVLKLVSATVDCDRDSLLLVARPAGPTCHRGTPSCFGGEEAPGLGFLAALENTVAERLANPSPGSYTASLAAAGLKRAAQKVGEEGVETALAAVAGDHEELVSESADLLFHLLVVLQMSGLEFSAVLACLRERHHARRQSVRE